MQYINESTFIQLIHANQQLIRIINDSTERHKGWLTYEESSTVAKVHELNQLAMMQAKQSGITVEVPNERK